MGAAGSSSSSRPGRIGSSVMRSPSADRRRAGGGAWRGSGPGWGRCCRPAYRVLRRRRRSRDGRRRRRRAAGCGSVRAADSMWRHRTRPSARRARRSRGRRMRRVRRARRSSSASRQRLRPAGTPSTTRQLSRLRRDDEPREDRPRVLDRVGVVDQPHPGGLDDVLRLVVADPLRAHGVPQQRGQQLDELGQPVAGRRPGRPRRRRRPDWPGSPWGVGRLIVALPWSVASAELAGDRAQPRPTALVGVDRRRACRARRACAGQLRRRGRVPRRTSRSTRRSRP